MTVAEMRNDTNLHRQYENEPQVVPTKSVDGQLCQEQKDQPVGLGITMANDTEWGQKFTETCSSSEWSFRMELNKWSTVFDEDDDFDDNIVKEL